jgi:hypothetical protein
MKPKPIVCLLDEDKEVQLGWQQALGIDADLYAYSDHHQLLAAAAEQRDLVPSFSCIIVGRYFKGINVDVVASNVPDLIREQGGGPILLNWQGYITKEEVMSKFDGKLFHRYGVKWQTLRLRIQKFERHTQQVRPAKSNDHASFEMDDPSIDFEPPKPRSMFENASRPERCEFVLKLMAKAAQGRHREKIEHYIRKDPMTGVRLLEAIYDRLLTDKNRPLDCPSRYINTSPVIAKRILHEALYQIS